MKLGRVVLFLFSITCFANGPVFNSGSSLNQKVIKTSPSFEIVKKCDPRWVEGLTSKWTLTDLKERLDRLYPTLKSTELEKEWTLIDPGPKTDKKKERHRVRVKTVNEQNRDMKKLFFEKLDKEGTGEPLPIPEEHKINPSQEVINLYLYKYDIETESLRRLDQKSKGNELESVKADDQITSLVFKEATKKQRLSCQQKVDIGILCLCDNLDKK